jgi:glycosyltransferase involved in cell wall biosynthesis
VKCCGRVLYNLYFYTVCYILNSCKEFSLRLKDMATVSVIMPAFNVAGTIDKAIDSLQRQTMPDFELIVVDDGSTDGTGELVKSRSCADARIKHIHLPHNLGVGGARNAALNIASGTWMTMLDADDWCEPERLEVLLRSAHDLHADLICDNLLLYDHAVEKVITKTAFGNATAPFCLTAEFLFANDHSLCPAFNSVGLAKPFVRTSFLRGVHITYNATYQVGEDFVFLAECLLKGAKAFIVPEAYYTYVMAVAPSTGLVSPASRSGKHFIQVIQGCDELLAAYGASMSPGEQRQLRRQKRLFEVWLTGREIKTAFTERNAGVGLKQLMRRPSVLIFAIRYALKERRRVIHSALCLSQKRCALLG